MATLRRQAGQLLGEAQDEANKEGATGWMGTIMIVPWATDLMDSI